MALKLAPEVVSTILTFLLNHPDGAPLKDIIAAFPGRPPRSTVQSWLSQLVQNNAITVDMSATPYRYRALPAAAAYLAEALSTGTGSPSASSVRATPAPIALPTDAHGEPASLIEDVPASSNVGRGLRTPPGRPTTVPAPIALGVPAASGTAARSTGAGAKSPENAAADGTPAGVPAASVPGVPGPAGAGASEQAGTLPASSESGVPALADAARAVSIGGGARMPDESTYPGMPASAKALGWAIVDVVVRRVIIGIGRVFPGTRNPATQAQLSLLLRGLFIAFGALIVGVGWSLFQRYEWARYGIIGGAGIAFASLFVLGRPSRPANGSAAGGASAGARVPALPTAGLPAGVPAPAPRSRRNVYIFVFWVVVAIAVAGTLLATRSASRPTDTEISAYLAAGLLTAAEYLASSTAHPGTPTPAPASAVTDDLLRAGTLFAGTGASTRGERTAIVLEITANDTADGS